MNMNRKIVKRAGLIAAAAAVTVSSAAVGIRTKETKTLSKDPVYAAEAEREVLTTTMSSSSFGNSDENTEKVETVYVKADATGEKNDVTVSDWLRNYKGEDEITDTTDLKDLENVKGDETCQENGDGTVTWKAGGKDIYYQGKTEKSLPVGVKVSYQLDGEDISVEDLAGKSGKVKIRFDYTNDAKKTVKVDGEEKEVTVPFAMISGMLLPSDHFSNVEVTNGEVISDATNNIVMGAALPGLKEALGLNEDKLEDLGLDSSIPDYVEVTADVKDFELGMTMTMASSNVLSGLGFSDIDNSESADKIEDDMEALKSAVKKLSDGSGQVKDGSGKLKSGTGALREAVKQYTNGTETLAAGLGRLNESMPALSEGTKNLAAGGSQVQNGLKATFASYQLVHATLGQPAYQGVLEAGADPAKAGAAMTALASSGSDAAYQAAEGKVASAYGTIAQAGSLSQTQQAWLTSTGMLKEEWDALLAKAGADAADGNTALAAADISCYASKLKVFNAKYEALIGGQDGKGTGSLSSGIDQLASGLAQLSYSVNQVDRTGKNPGLYQAVSLLAGGGKALTANNSALNEGAASLDEGAKKLYDGSQALDDGMARFDEEGINKLSKAFSGDISSFADRLKSVDDAARAYTSFSGASDDMTSSVKFLIETEGIGTEED